mmetsp:Transcript_16851/g.24667  ORF Transcript_16851/g.24667 Transcript_16851/m.24667 type:complete len:643 (+) Transcript_16851:147-2075(+)|eukprot:CAMPEP_0195529250 /NCGR_PEP_ID=MMETSP0794_2-20130614/31713_1 /TAXON_ID=515487 /ORGANISM="Stephanopyxis turris, Strain CCMP 815" /LENGTH=642 /DNA_ID=CAMNT_0040660531 /DNA_START=147 /DNA_END=2075 /DNA_ORIENTATION=-
MTRGMRTILKQKPSPIQQIQNKLNAGLYDNTYPVEHEILTLNPPIAEYGGVSSDAKNRRGKKGHHRGFELHLPTDPLVKAYLNRTNEPKDPSNVVGVGDADSWMGYNKGKNMTDAYDFASRQYDYILRNYDGGRKYSDLGKGAALNITKKEMEDSVKAIEEVLKLEDREERIKSRRMAETVKEDMDGMKASQEAQEKEQDDEHVQDTSQGAALSTETKTSTDANLEGVPSILHSNTRSIMEMRTWGERLNQVKYSQWTLGAVTSLDHWIATSILQITEKSWQDVLHKKDLSRAKDIIAVRASLFPETLMDGHTATADRTLDAFADDHDDDVQIMAESETEKSIDELLASLGVDDDDDQDDMWNTQDDQDAAEQQIRWDESEEQKFTRLKKELNDWQARNHEVNYDQWAEKEKKRFNDWLIDYVASLTTGDEGPVDLNETRYQILSEPYFSPEQSETMWNTLADDTDAEILLQELLENSNELLANESGGDWKIFMELSYEEQLNKLKRIGKLRPIHDDAYPSSSWGNENKQGVDEFVGDNIDIFREGVVVEDITPDLEGSITAKDLYHGLPVDENRFAYKTVSLGMSEKEKKDAERIAEHDLVLYKAWAKYHANRKNIEEELFREGLIGLRRNEGNDKSNKKE